MFSYPPTLAKQRVLPCQKKVKRSVAARIPTDRWGPFGPVADRRFRGYPAMTNLGS